MTDVLGGILLCIVLWAACCGVTVGGSHYDVSCSCDTDRGVVLHQERR